MPFLSLYVCLFLSFTVLFVFEIFKPVLSQTSITAEVSYDVCCNFKKTQVFILSNEISI